MRIRLAPRFTHGVRKLGVIDAECGANCMPGGEAKEALADRSLLVCTAVWKAFTNDVR